MATLQALDQKLPWQELTEKIRSELISNAEEEAAPIVAGAELSTETGGEASPLNASAGHPGVHGLAAWPLNCP